MNSVNTNPVTMYVDKHTLSIDNAASFISKMGRKAYRNAIENKTLLFAGSYQCRQNFPYMTEKGVARMLYGKEVIILPIEKIKEGKNLNNQHYDN